MTAAETKSAWAEQRRLHHSFELTWQGVGVDLTILADLEDAVEHVIPRIGTFSEKLQHLIQKPQAARSTNRWQNNEAWMHVRTADEPAEVASILGDQDAVLFDASPEDGMVEFSAPSNIKRMKSIKSELIEAASERR